MTGLPEQFSELSSDERTEAIQKALVKLFLAGDRAEATAETLKSGDFYQAMQRMERLLEQLQTAKVLSKEAAIALAALTESNK
jgi:hypothetical protein